MSFDGQVVGMAGVLQAARLVVDVAHQGQCEPAAFAASIESVLRIDADSPAAIFGGMEQLRIGLDQLAATLEAGRRHPQVTRIMVALLHLERTLSSKPNLLNTIRTGVNETLRSAEALGPTHQTVIVRLAEIYTQTISTMSPRIMVEGNSLFLAQEHLLARIRALLLAGIRAAVLWRQMGGTHLALLFKRKRMAEAAKAMIA